MVLGISADSMRSHELFAAKLNLPFPLLSDSDRQVIRLYGANKMKIAGKLTIEGIARSTFLVDKAGVIRKVWPSVTVDGHAADVLQLVRQM